MHDDFEEYEPDPVARAARVEKLRIYYQNELRKRGLNCKVTRCVNGHWLTKNRTKYDRNGDIVCMSCVRLETIRRRLEPRTTCAHGHDLSQHAVERTKNGRVCLQCRECERAAVRKYKAKKRGQANA